MSFLSPNFYIRSIRIGSIEDASCLNMGNNFPVGFQSFKKQNQGFGEINGDYNELEGIKTLLKDTKLVDILNQLDEGEGIPPWMEPYLTAAMPQKHT